jgi:hypothetical protein
MKVEFKHRAQVAGVTYEVGDIADIDADIGHQLIDGQHAIYLGDGDRHTDTWNDLVQLAAGINPTGAVNAPAYDDVETNWPGTLLFSGSADNLLCGQWQTSHEWNEGTAILPHIHWMLTADSSNAVGWEFYYRVTGVGEAADAWVGPIAGTLAISHQNTANFQAITTFGAIPLTEKHISVIVAWRLYRRGATDANANTARLLSIDAHYRKNSTGSKQEYIKD